MLFFFIGFVFELVVMNICFYNDMEKVINMFLFVYMFDECYWGLVIFLVIEYIVFFDDGYYCLILEDLKFNVLEIFRFIY